MRQFAGQFLLLLSVLAGAAQTVLAQGKSPALVAVPVDIVVPFAPVPVQAMGKANLVYEVHITNFDRTGLVLQSAQVFADAPGQTPLASYQGQDIVKRLAVLNYVQKQAPDVIGSGQRAILFLLVSTDPAAVPTALRHRFTFKSAEPADSASAGQVIDNIRVAVPREAPVVLRAPVRGRWLAGNGLSNDTGHRRSIIPTEGHVRIAQRFATDWVQLGDDGRLARGGDMSQNQNYYGYGAEALAVADATVVEVKDGIPENVPQTKKRAVPITLETIAGNYVLLDLGKGRFALYAHFQPQSLRVKAGDKVKAGQVLGRVGNSGNSDLPHLHFHVMNAPSPLGAEGLPYVLTSWQLQGTAEVNAEFVKNGFRPTGSPQEHRAEIPIQNAVVVLP